MKEPSVSTSDTRSMRGVHGNDVGDFDNYYASSTKVHNLHLKDHVTSDRPITLGEFQKLRKEGKA